MSSFMTATVSIWQTVQLERIYGGMNENAKLIAITHRQVQALYSVQDH